MPATYEKINSYLVTGSATATITFNSIPSTYTDLKVIIHQVSNSGGNDFYMRFNNDNGTNYNRQITHGYNATVVGLQHANYDRFQIGYAAVGVNTNEIGMMNIDIFQYSATDKYKNIHVHANSPYTATYETAVNAGVWASTNAITSIRFAGNGDFTTADMGVGTRISLYGIKAA